MTVVEVYEVYLKGEEFVYAFESKELFESKVGDFVRENYEIDFQTYSNVGFSERELNTLQEKGYVLID